MPSDSTKSSERRSVRLHHIKYLKKYFPDAKKVLCVGARNKSEVNTFSEEGYDAIGIDKKYASRGRNGPVRKMAIEKIPPSWEKNFDVTYASHVLSDIDDVRHVFKIIKKVTKQACMLVLRLYESNTSIAIRKYMIAGDDNDYSLVEGVHRSSREVKGANLLDISPALNDNNMAILDCLLQDMCGKIIHFEAMADPFIVKRRKKEVFIIIKLNDNN